MKITIAYTPEEAQQANTIMTFLWHFLPETTTRKSTKHPPFTHIYICTKDGRKSRKAN